MAEKKQKERKARSWVEGLAIINGICFVLLMVFIFLTN
jgi:hypothetical protein